MEIRWLTASIDLPVDRFELGAAFWQKVTESRLSAPRGADEQFDQVCIDVPAPLFEQEAVFWRELTGWELHRSQLVGFAVLHQPPTSPLRLLFQRLGADDDAEATRAHLDIACGQRVEDVRQLHERFGAEFVAQGLRWMTMRDPAGMLYCLTERDPTSGQIMDGRAG